MPPTCAGPTSEAAKTATAGVDPRPPAGAADAGPCAVETNQVAPNTLARTIIVHGMPEGAACSGAFSGGSGCAFGTRSRFIGRPITRCSIAQARHAPRQPNAWMKDALNGQPTVLAKPANSVMPVIALRASRAVETGHGGESRLIEPEAHAEAKDRPGHGEAGGIGGQRQQNQPGGEHEIGCGQHIPPAMPVDDPPGERPEQAREQQRGREDAEKPGARDVQVRRDRIGEHRRQIIGRAPGERLRDAERGDDDATPAPSILCRSSALVPAARAAHDVHHRKHHRHFDQHADDGRKRRAGLESEQRDRRRHGQLEEIAGADQRRRPGDAPFDAEPRG